MEILEVKTTIRKENSLDRLSSRVQMAREKISEFDN